MSDPDREERAWAASSALELVSTSYLVADPDITEDVADFPLPFALDVLSYLEALQSVTRKVRKQLEVRIAQQLYGVKYYRHHDSIVKVGGSGTWRVKDEAVNDGTLAAFIGEDWPQIVNLKASGAVTKTRLESLAKQRADTDDPEWLEEVARLVRSTLFTYETNDDAISVMPLDKAPKSAQKLEDGKSIAAKQVAAK